MSYPNWSYFPRNARPPEWAHALAKVAADIRTDLDTTKPAASGVDRKSDAVLGRLRPGLETLGFKVETGKSKSQKITKPVLFGEDGRPEVSYDIDGFHDGLGIVLEVEAGRGAANGADYRDLVRTSLLLDAEFLALFMPVEYHFTLRGQPKRMLAYRETLRQLEAIYASRRLQLPFQGVLLVGY